ncbi:MAG: hypothetical protein AAF871_16685 [Pseudomonadota bacterium]
MDKTAPELACKLTQFELRQRKSDIRQSLTPHLVSSSYVEGMSHLAFRKPSVSRAQLEHLIALEQACCPFFSFSIRETDKEFTLIVSGPEGSEDLVRDLFLSEQSTTCGGSGRMSQSNQV